MTYFDLLYVYPAIFVAIGKALILVFAKKLPERPVIATVFWYSLDVLMPVFNLYYAATIVFLFLRAIVATTRKDKEQNDSKEPLVTNPNV